MLKKISPRLTLLSVGLALLLSLSAGCKPKAEFRIGTERRLRADAFVVLHRSIAAR